MTVKKMRRIPPTRKYDNSRPVKQERLDTREAEQWSLEE